MKLLMVPHYNELGLNNGVGQVLYNYHKYLPQVGIEIVTNKDDDYDLSAGHFGHMPEADITFNHGFWWGNDISDMKRQQNAILAKCCVNAKAVIVPSNFVAETIKRDLKINPYIIPHGVNFNEWQHKFKSAGYVLWNKTRASAVCDPQPVSELAKRFPSTQFVTTFANSEAENIKTVGRVPFKKMQTIIQKSHIYLSTAKETFGIGTLEALASGVPVLGFDWGGTSDIITHKKDGYLVSPYDYDALAEGLKWLLDNRDKLQKNCIMKARQYNWLNVAKKIKGVCKDVLYKR